jgi:hypothetical protein
VLRLESGAVHQRVCSPVSPEPVDQLPSTSTSLPSAASRSTQRATAAAGEGSAQRTWRHRTTSYAPAVSGGSAASPTAKVVPGNDPALARARSDHLGGEVEAVDLVSLLGE